MNEIEKDDTTTRTPGDRPGVPQRRARYTIMRTIDAVVVYEAEVEADSPAEATKYAEEHEDEVFAGQFRQTHGDVIEYAARNFVALDEEGDEIEESKTGDCV